MKITASKRDEIIKRRDEFDEAARARKEATDKEVDNWRKATQAVFTEVEDVVKSEIPKTSLVLEVRASSSFIGIDRDGIEVRISNQNRSPYAEGNALSWDWTVKLNREGEVVKQSNSWSGLKATTVEELQSLEDSVTVLKAINNFDWKEILSKALPAWDDYVQDRGPNPKRPNFEYEILEEDLRECIENQYLVKGVAGDTSGFRSGIQVYYLIERETPKQYVVSEIAQFQLDQMGSIAEAVEHAKGRYTYKITKEKFYQLIGKEVEILTDEEV